ncbi:hypothetical protein [Streptomyces xanthophaeus]
MPPVPPVHSGASIREGPEPHYAVSIVRGRGIDANAGTVIEFQFLILGRCGTRGAARRGAGM